MERIKKVFNSEAGMTLIELLASITIFFLIIGVVIGFLLQTNHFVSQTNSTVIQEGNSQALRLLLQDTFSSGIEIAYTEDPQEIKVRQMDGTCHSFNVNKEQKTLYHYERKCDALMDFKYPEQGEAFKGISGIKLDSLDQKGRAFIVKIEGDKNIQYSFNLLNTELQK
ncbi:PilW family protein [Falsibacillus pallidus]|uniref:Prepilin-type N-terminal cleavage/methylation domain-containing protein n=1 Tax=Falsibacillus pallidus TaxID=493781 RepID=A0A370GK58_9BACI|nr:prepilin-type N-terminal cleavage/methylation domain-containing protein [Falsibacillus pallidus]RDI44162.1 hypothetical protein DFR59_103228 [Falsibacillus pallidus]